MKILVIGGYGYLGGRLADYLSGIEEHEVILGSSRDHVKTTGKNKTVKINWDSLVALENICAGMDVIIHASGMNADDSFRDPLGALEVNGVYTARLLSAAVNKKVPRFIYFSSAHVYMSPLHGTITEATCPVSLHPYATSHKAGEDIVRHMHYKKSIEGIVVRLSNSFGAPIEKSANCWMLFVNDLCMQAVTTDKMIIKSSGVQKRDFIALSAVCKAAFYLTTLSGGKLGNGLFNLGGEWSPSLLEMANRIADRFNILYSKRIVVEIGQAADESMPLKYVIDKLKHTGLELNNAGMINEEIDKLIDFCKRVNDNR